MKYVAIYLNQTGSQELFLLSSLLNLSLNDVATCKDDNENCKYEVITADNLKTVHDLMIQLNLNVTMDKTPDPLQRPCQILHTKLNHVILVVADDFRADNPLEDYVGLIYLLRPENFRLEVFENEIANLESEIAASTKNVGVLPAADITRQINLTLDRIQSLSEFRDKLLAKPVQYAGPQFERLFPYPHNYSATSSSSNKVVTLGFYGKQNGAKPLPVIEHQVSVIKHSY